MREQQPITVVIPTLDEAPWIRAAVESVAAIFVRTTLLNWIVVVLGSAGFPRRRLARLHGARG